MAIDFEPHFDFQPEEPNPNQPTLGNVLPKMLGLQATEMPMNALKDVGENIQGIGSALKSGLYDIPKAIGSLPQELSHDITQGKVPTPEDTSLGQLTKQGVEGMKQGLTNIVKNPIKSAVEHPVTTASLFVGMPEAEGLKGVTSKWTLDAAKTAESRIPGLNKTLANIPELGTEIAQHEGFKFDPIKAGDIEKAADNVSEAFNTVKEKYGSTLNKAKSEMGIPTSPEEIDKSLLEYQNTHGFDPSQPLKLPEHFTKKAPTMEEAPIQPFKVGDKLTLKSDKPGMPELTVNYNGPMMKDSPGLSPELKKLAKEPMFNLEQDIPAHEKDVMHPTNSTVAKSTLEMRGYKIPEGMSPEAPKSSLPMPFTIGDIKTPENLSTEIGRFIKNRDFISASDRAKAASYLQDQIINKIDIEKPQGKLEGYLKKQYGELAKEIEDASPALQEAKSGMRDVYKTVEGLTNKLKTGGRAHAYIRRLFRSDSPAAKEELRKLAEFEQLTGKPVVSELLRKFSAEAYSKWVSRAGLEVAEAAHGAAWGMLGHPGAALGTGVLLAAQSPKVLGAIGRGANVLTSGLAKLSPTAALQTAKQGFPLSEESLSKLQSIKDKMRK